MLKIKHHTSGAEIGNGTFCSLGNVRSNKNEPLLVDRWEASCVGQRSVHGCFHLHLTERDQKGNTVPVKEMCSQLFCLSV